jgi:hypothetical protein
MAHHCTDGAFAAQVTARGWADAPTLEAMAAAWRAWGEHPDAFYERLACQVVGWRAGPASPSPAPAAE